MKAQFSFALPNPDNEFESLEELSDSHSLEMSDINQSKSGEVQHYPYTHNSENRVDNNPLNEFVSWQQFFSLLLKTGGWTVAVLLAFRLVVIPLLTAGNTPVACILAIAVSVFLVLRAVGALIRELKR
ncbi:MULTISPECIES: hypothetical protein [unclassified Tolypothrix]|uniref:hypothetical protein n=1 Tax=unclassified Tolypothrix TaxID=2649714 RepID=UPI0005EAB5F2|nr:MULTISPECIES: hypothetical protein [unclassified Tolypothrix]BAY95940.1 hypothetical protein NIES3275_80170 [Microchaete diplosiphon NIES-3275]EKE96527.1 hypothetical protein FDUTEX481_06598 [Tolypothrix sp. PCC 7601]MBE9084087.1 hypothetical protein [Tolypothrix sp. LEGE 11397]UYD31021.1 hypothetical protein HGR01_39785 [Tolypothrix sp. PCC 7712]UYD38872.1 hypothetical protein HG267_41020 [Tolypothrix sp. PCC 7601]